MKKGKVLSKRCWNCGALINLGDQQFEILKVLPKERENALSLPEIKKKLKYKYASWLYEVVAGLKELGAIDWELRKSQDKRERRFVWKKK